MVVLCVLVVLAGALHRENQLLYAGLWVNAVPQTSWNQFAWVTQREGLLIMWT